MHLWIDILLTINVDGAKPSLESETIHGLERVSIASLQLLGSEVMLHGGANGLNFVVDGNSAEKWIVGASLRSSGDAIPPLEGVIGQLTKLCKAGEQRTELLTYDPHGGSSQMV